jgi:hypothetical protein
MIILALALLFGFCEAVKYLLGGMGVPEPTRSFTLFVCYFVCTIILLYVSGFLALHAA